MPRMTGKQALAEMLLAEGVEYIFGNPGTSETPLMDALQDYPQLQYVTSLQEASAVGMADGYARATGKPAFANVHIAAGLANAVSMLYDAYRGGTPLDSDCGELGHADAADGPHADGESGGDDPAIHQVECSDYPCVGDSDGSATGVPGGHHPAHRPCVPSVPVELAGRRGRRGHNGVIGRLLPLAAGHGCGSRGGRRFWPMPSVPLWWWATGCTSPGAMAEAVRAAELLGARVHAAAFAEVNFPTSHPQFLGALNLNRGQTKDLFAGADVVLAVGANVFQSFLYVPDPFLGPNHHPDTPGQRNRGNREGLSHPRRHDCRPQVRLGRLVRCVGNPRCRAARRKKPRRGLRLSARRSRKPGTACAVAPKPTGTATPCRRNA